MLRNSECAHRSLFGKDPPPGENDCSRGNRHQPANLFFTQEQLAIFVAEENWLPSIPAIHHMINRPFVRPSQSKPKHRPIVISDPFLGEDESEHRSGLMPLPFAVTAMLFIDIVNHTSNALARLMWPIWLHSKISLKKSSAVVCSCQTAGAKPQKSTWIKSAILST